MSVSGSFYGATVFGNMSPDDEEQAKVLGSRAAQMANYLKDGGMTSIF